ncbi:hypothetical protein ASC75_20945 [Aminobacter sp. DSM 101952]|nr:hypothetical protein ASC75_20945 [Aminobacter sp. DSM 101952]
MIGTLAVNVILHEAVRQELEQRVESGNYKSGTMLPSTAALAREFGVSAITIKRVLRDLQTSGVLRSVAGLGTFVRERRRFVRNLDFSLNSLDDANRLGIPARVEPISINREYILDPQLAEFAAAPKDKPMICIRKAIIAQAEKIMHDTTYVSIDLDDKTIDEFSRRLVMEVLAERGLEFTSSRIMIDAAPGPPEVCQVFSLPRGYPVLRRLYKLTTASEDQFVAGMAQSPFDRLACTTEIDLAHRADACLRQR